MPYVPSFDYVLIDLSTILERLPAFASDYAKLTGVLLQNSRHKRLLASALSTVADSVNRLLMNEQGEQFVGTSVIYLRWVTELTNVELFAIFRTVSRQAEAYTMSLQERTLQEGREQGIEQGIRAMLKLNMDATTIAAALEYPLDRVLAIVRQVDAERN